MSGPFWYLASGKEVPHRIADSDRGEWKALNDLGTEPQALRWRPVTIELEVELELPDLFASGSKRMASRRLRALCDQFQVNAEYLPVKIRHPGGQVSENHSIIHPLERIDCIDFGASDFDRYGTAEKFTVARYRRLVFRPEAIGARAVFRPQRDPSMFTSKEFRDAVLSAGLSVNFRPPEGQEEAK